MKHSLFWIVSIIYGGLWAQCQNAHCQFEYVGYSIGRILTQDDFLGCLPANATGEKYFHNEFMSFRELNWHLYELEKSVSERDAAGVSNEIYAVMKVLRAYENRFLPQGAPNLERSFQFGLRMLMMEKIEYSLARLVLRENRDMIANFIDVLVPDDVLNASRSRKSWHAISTFKTMLRLAVHIEDYRDAEGCYPLNLGMLNIPESYRKCACGRDVEYEYYDLTWVLRSRCESYEGGLRFDEYLPMIHSQRKRLDLCFSPSFSRKRVTLFNGEDLSRDDRLRGTVIHDPSVKGVHGMRFAFPLAGCGRVAPLSEQKAGDMGESVNTATSTRCCR